MSDAHTHSHKHTSTQRLMYYVTICLWASNTAGQMANSLSVKHSTVAALNNRAVGVSQTNTETSPQVTDSQSQYTSQYRPKDSDYTIRIHSCVIVWIEEVKKLHIYKTYI